MARPRAQAGLALLLLAFVVVQPFQLFTPARAKAHTVAGPVQVGTSFSARRAAELGLDYQAAFKQVEAMHFRIIRLSAYWDEIETYGYGDLDWLMAESARSGQPVVLSVGVKGLGWPEFYIPARALPPAGIKEGHDVAEDPGLREAARAFIESTVMRYRDNDALIAWQVENEPFNRAGPQRWWIDKDFLKEEIAAVKAKDHRSRPVIVNAFSHFNLIFDQASNRNGLDFKRLLGFDADSAEKDSLSVLAPGDILGLDVYTAIGYHFLGQNHLAHADGDWAEQVGRLHRLASGEGKQAWITEAQAEPWEATRKTFTDPLSTSPKEIQDLFLNLKDAGYTTVLLWGSEYWVWRAESGDPSWMQAVRQILREESRAPAVALPVTSPRT